MRGRSWRGLDEHVGLYASERPLKLPGQPDLESAPIVVEQGYRAAVMGEDVRQPGGEPIKIGGGSARSSVGSFGVSR
jgi:hypothetical protein